MAENIPEQGAATLLEEEEGLRRIVVVGAGTMGQGIALAAAKAGIHVHIVEKNDAILRESNQSIESALDLEIQRWSLTESEKRVQLSRLQGGTELSAAADADVVVEAIPERFELKKRLLTQIEQEVTDDTILVSNTATLSISELSAGLKHPARLIGMHFIYPVTKVPLVEIVRGLNTSDDTYASAVQFAERLGKTPVQVFEYPGFITTRVMVPYLNEAMHIVMEGVATADDVDTAMRVGYDFPWGPLELADRMGLDEVMSWSEHLFRELGDPKYRPCPLLRKMVRAGQWGAKSGQGFFTYRKDGRRVK